jgi:hypothetical protein
MKRDSAALLLEAGLLYRFQIENDYGCIVVRVDDAPVISWVDSLPVWGPRHCHVGFVTQGCEVHVENVKVFHRVPKPSIPDEQH